MRVALAADERPEWKDIAASLPEKEVAAAVDNWS